MIQILSCRAEWSRGAFGVRGSRAGRAAAVAQRYSKRRAQRSVGVSLLSFHGAQAAVHLSRDGLLARKLATNIATSAQTLGDCKKSRRPCVRERAGVSRSRLCTARSRGVQTFGSTPVSQGSVMRSIAAGRVLGLLSRHRSRNLLITSPMRASADTSARTLRSSSSVMRSCTCAVSASGATQNE